MNEKPTKTLQENSLNFKKLALRFEKNKSCEKVIIQAALSRSSHHEKILLKDKTTTN